jgi:hypothetical protein
VKFRLVRHKETEYATYGTLFTEFGHAVCVTIERPFVDADNDGKRDPNVCRIQHGVYPGIRRESPKRGYAVWWLCDVPDVSRAGFPDVPTATTCQMHRANFPGDLQGCIGLGTAFGDLPDRHEGGERRPAVTASEAAFNKFMALTASVQEITLEIIDNFGAPAGAFA